MSSPLKVYFASNDVLVSEAPTQTNAVSFTLRADLEQTASVRLYAKNDSGYKTTSTTVVGAGTGIARWETASDNAGSPGTYQAANVSLSLGEVTTSPTYFWVRASAVIGEAVAKDVSVTFDAEGIAEVV
jgi:hypothetical protein